MTFVYPGAVDMVRARDDAAKALAKIDWSKDDIVVWVPGTDGTDFTPNFRVGMERAWKGGSMTAVSLDYQATWHLDTSEPTGEAALKLLLAGIKAHGGRHRVLLGGLSQGAWIIGDVLADPAMQGIVTRTALWGHPSISEHHYPADATAPIREYNHAEDIIAMPIVGSRVQAIEAMTALETGAILPNLWLIATTVARNPHVGFTAIGNVLRDKHLLPPAKVDWHNYDAEYLTGTQWLHDAPPLAAAQAVRGRRLLAARAARGNRAPAPAR